MTLLVSNRTRALIAIMCALVLSAIVISHFYYKSVNDSVDPRIVEARKLYEKYNLYTQRNELKAVFWLMDSIEQIYASYPHYKNSYEVGVLYNNRAAAYLTLGLFADSIQSGARDSLFILAEDAANTSVNIYSHWLEIKSSTEDLTQPTFCFMVKYRVDPKAIGTPTLVEVNIVAPLRAWVRCVAGAGNCFFITRVAPHDSVFRPLSSVL
jgi:hypothetical protein